MKTTENYVFDNMINMKLQNYKSLNSNKLKINDVVL